MENDLTLVQNITSLLGNEVYINGKLDRTKVSAIIFHDPGKLQKLNSLVHPATISYANDWFAKQRSPYVIKEAAIFFESDSYKEMDVMIGVFAPVELRIERTVKRSGMDREKILSIMAQQMSEEEKMKRCDHVIFNDDVSAVLPQVLKLHEQLLINYSSPAAL